MANQKSSQYLQNPTPSLSSDLYTSRPSPSLCLNPLQFLPPLPPPQQVHNQHLETGNHNPFLCCSRFAAILFPLPTSTPMPSSLGFDPPTATLSTTVDDALRPLNKSQHAVVALPLPPKKFLSPSGSMGPLDFTPNQPPGRALSPVQPAPARPSIVYF